MKKMARKIIICLLLAGIMQCGLSAAVSEAASQQDLEEQSRQTLDNLVDAYRQNNLIAFMTLVSSDFRDDFSAVEQAVRRDLQFFSDIDLRCSVVSVSSSDERVELTVSYQRRIISAKDGKSYKDSGLTQLQFASVDGKMKLFSMKYPLLFGLSDAHSLAAGGIVSSAENVETLTVDRQGNAAVVPFRQAR